MLGMGQGLKGLHSKGLGNPETSNGRSPSWPSGELLESRGFCF